MTILRQVVKLGFVWALVGSLLVATGRGNESEPAGQTKDEPPKYSKIAVLEALNAAIAKAGDPKAKRALVAMRKCVEGGDTTLALRHNQLTELPPEIGKLTKLRILYLTGNQLTKEAIAALIKQLPNCHVSPRQ
jgi:hypothetical protein